MLQRRLLVGGMAAVAAALAVVYHDDPRQLPFDAASAAGPLLRLADAETSHNAGLRAATWGLFPRETRPDPPELAVVLWGRNFRNPLGAHLKLNPDLNSDHKLNPHSHPYPISRLKYPNLNICWVRSLQPALGALPASLTE
jgi:hypothetical protein